MNEFLSNPSIKTIVPGLLLACLIWLSFAVIRHFLHIITWAILIAYVMWPPYRWLKRKLHNNATLSAAVMTGVISTVITLTIYWLVNLLQGEVKLIYQILLSNFAHPPKQLPEIISNIPWLGHYLQDQLNAINADEAGMKTQLIDWAKQWLGEIGLLLRGVGRNMIQFGFTLVTLFFCFRDGQRVIIQLSQSLSYFLGNYHLIYLKAAGDTARACVYGLAVAALGQGLLAGFGYAVAGVNAPVLFGVLTALFSVVPFVGASLVWLPVSFGLILSDQLLQGIGLMLWGFFFISLIDNIIRPLVISGAGRIPLLVVVFGVFGGLTAFGAIGLFLGPIILSVLLAVWQAWLNQQNPTS